MTAQAWITLVGVVASVLLTVGPWLAAMHAKLAVLASQIGVLCDHIEKLASAHERRLEMCIEHQSRLEAYEVQLVDLAERIRNIETGE